MDGMRIRLEFQIPCSAIRAWEAVHEPKVAADLYRPLLVMAAGSGGFPPRFASGDRVRVTMRLLGRVPIGAQLIAIEDVTLPTGFPAGARTMRDAGRPLTGPLSLLAGWNHEITIWSAEEGRAVWHDELTVRGVFAPVYWPVLWSMWKWRQRKLQRLAQRW